MRSLAEEHPDIELDFQDGQEDANVQVNILQTFIEQEKDLVVVFANQTDTLTAAVNQVVDAGIPVINTQGYVGDGANTLTFRGLRRLRQRLGPGARCSMSCWRRTARPISPRSS